MRFEWDSLKAETNLQKHGVDFNEASTVFYDAQTKIAADDEHSINEERFLAVGFSSASRLLLIVHCYRESDEVIRIISARKLTRSERKDFEEGL